MPTAAQGKFFGPGGSVGKRQEPSGKFFGPGGSVHAQRPAAPAPSRGTATTGPGNFFGPGGSVGRVPVNVNTPAYGVAAAPPPGAPPPFLTPTQQAGLNSGLLKDTTAVSNYQLALGNYITNANARLSADQRVHDVRTDGTNQTLAARGMFQSSIRDGDLNDLDLTLATQRNSINNGVAVATTKYNTLINEANANAGILQATSAGLAASNGLASDPGTGSMPAGGAAGASPGGAPANPQPQGPTPTNPGVFHPDPGSVQIGAGLNKPVTPVPAQPQPGNFFGPGGSIATGTHPLPPPFFGPGGSVGARQPGSPTNPRQSPLRPSGPGGGSGGGSSVGAPGGGR